ncbi:MAG: 3-phosphoserine/phosphohydroxythreonine transaminase [Acidobacteriota bacterium]|nr:3-phosphoserine/phosphohydroxythreonine transaminase [Acidobacteriota bacterium]MDH3529909.1 3-phosphoserine/phosphohydroxythreonine transaminase [Acidobacteriota bacterium]
MSERIFNFSAGPACLPEPVLEQAQSELLSLGGIGMSVMEISHRSSIFGGIIESAENGLRSLMEIPGNYRVLFLQGGATLQFSMIPINFLGEDDSADYVVTGAWGKKAAKEARREGTVNEVYNSGDGGFRSIPVDDELSFDPDARYIHFTSNETIEGVEFDRDIDGSGVPVICDMSSNIMSRPVDVSKYALIYAGAQKNIGPSGVTLVIIRDDLLDMVPDDQHTLLDYRAIASKGSMLNTPNTWGIYIIDLVCKWLEEMGGIAEMAKINRQKAGMIYDAIDASDGFYSGHADRKARSMMNVTFNLPTEDLEKRFTAEAAAKGLDGLKGHRSVGGIRASIYNAFPVAGVTALIDFMKEFRRTNG